MEPFKAMMEGKERLVITYWLWGVMFTTGVSFLVGILGVVLGLPFIVLYLLVLAYWIPVAMGIWRSSSAYQGNQIWAILAKVAVVLGGLVWVYRFSMEFQT